MYQQEASERAVSETSQIMLPEPSRAFERRKLELWRKLQRLVSENSTSASRSSFFPNGRPRTRPAPRRYPTSADEGTWKRGIKRGVVDPIPWYRVGRTHSLPSVFSAIAVERVDT